MLSSGSVPDLLALQFDLGKVALNQDENLPSCIVKYVEIPPQVEKGKLEEVREQGSSVSGTIVAATVTNLIVSVLLAGPLTQLWAMIEGL